ncbi:MAG: hypothetical protein LKJ78_04310 [Serratia liquefaciens]|jgi:hypothetical protein|uniref:hypothetical protein n=1 Tax=Serratia liquefaciens TaxID=614 RepID=UPI001008543B|nr:hypothetical protein [Serratia liquefaciens]MCH4196896.1 hypothetical protein [Serratia liquefaciens]MCH4231735.1 hypothetical protein [Serratia liquefaciens]MCH4260684.1 hypothetical protein [Serratia liquefaciens]MCI1213514.1 hypothetical protein [Serratia liquefaciens]MCI1234871.1 hypothetical protein [Serratia liquefaciens]
MVITEQIDNSPKNSRKFYGWISADAMIEYAIFAKNYSTGGRQAGQKNGQLNGCPMVNRKVKLI